MTIQELLNKRAEVFRSMQELRGRADANGTFNAEDEAKWARMDADWKALTANIQREEENEKRIRQMAEVDFNTREQIARTTGSKSKNEPVNADPAYERAFWNFMASGPDALSEQDFALLSRGKQIEKRGTNTQITTTNNLGGYLVPTTFLNRIIETMAYFGPMLDICDVLETDGGGVLTIPTVDDTATLATQQTTEGSSITIQDFTFGQKTVGGYTYGSLVKASEQELQDEAIGLANFISRGIGKRIGRRANNHLTLGTGTNQPEGLMTAATVGKTAAATNAFTINEMIDLKFSLNSAYRRSPKCVWQMNSSTVGYIQKLAIGTNDARGLWEPSMQNGTPDRILGHAYYENDDIAGTLAANAKIMAFGDHESAYLVRKVRNFVSKRLDERFAEELAVGFIVATRIDGKLVDSAAVKVLRLAAS